MAAESLISTEQTQIGKGEHLLSNNIINQEHFAILRRL